MQLTVDLNEEQFTRLSEMAERFGVSPNELAHAACADLLKKPDDEFQRSLDYLLDKNRELYDRLS